MKAWSEVKVMEELRFGKKSYFRKMREGLEDVMLDVDLDEWKRFQ